MLSISSTVFDVVEEAIYLMLNETILNYEYDAVSKSINLK